MKKECFESNVSADDREVDIMPTMELLEFERVAYIKGMEDYLQSLKLLPNSEAVKKAKKSLESCHIIQENGEFTEKYKHNRL